MEKSYEPVDHAYAKHTANAFVSARLAATSLASYPGDPPATLALAYAVQDEAIRLWPDDIAGWKVGRIGDAVAAELGCNRLVGPIFRRSVHRAANGGVQCMPVFREGFAAIEGEFVLVLRDDAPPAKMRWSIDEAGALIDSVRAGVEIASSPFPGINELGPLVTISDFGNNFGLILGPEIPDWREFRLDEWRCETFIGEHRVGVNTAASLCGGPVESLRFLLENAAGRGLPLKKGMAISTGAVTGVHEVQVGQQASVRFVGLGDIPFDIVAAEASGSRVSAGAA